VVWVLAFLSFLALAFSSRGVFSLGLSKRMENEMQRYSITHSGAAFAKAVLMQDLGLSYEGLNQPWAHDEILFLKKHLGEGWFSLWYDEFNPLTEQFDKRHTLEDEERKINLNTASEETLTNLFEVVLGLERNLSVELSEAILDWRDEDDKRMKEGAEKYDYLSSDHYGYESKNGNFESVEELMLIKGMTPEIFNAVRPNITVYGSGKVNINTAKENTLLALGFDERAVEKILQYRLGGDGEAGTPDDQNLISDDAILIVLESVIPREELHQLTKLIEESALTVRSTAFRFKVEGHIEEEEGEFLIECVLDKEGKILFWAEI